MAASTDVVAPSKKVTFTLKSTPHRPADLKTIQRLMRMNRSVQKGWSGSPSGAAARTTSPGSGLAASGPTA